MNAVISGIYLKDFSKILLSLSKIGDELSIEAKKNKVLFSSLNATKSAFGLITFSLKFFEKYEYFPCEQPFDISKNSQTLKCKVQIRLLLAIFKSRNLENRDTKNISVQKCELKLMPPNGPEVGCYLIIRFLCKYGVLKTYKITYEQFQIMHALYDKSSCRNTWKINSRILKEHLDHFSTRAEELTLMIQNDKLLLTSFAEGLIHDKEILKQPIQTTILLDKRDFEEINSEDQSIITFPFKEFKAVVILGDSMNILLSAYFNTGGAPILFELEKDALSLRFIFATTSENMQKNTPVFGFNKLFSLGNSYEYSQNHTQTNGMHFPKNKNTPSNIINNDNMQNCEENTYNDRGFKNSIEKNNSDINSTIRNTQNSSEICPNIHVIRNIEKNIEKLTKEISSEEEIEPSQEQSNIKGIFD
ncbi:hypothetical protein PCK1_002328 [Pneumocystis canis]|nr:hypothetical protein PCK1_002328 [Pneumocystis canis]